MRLAEEADGAPGGTTAELRAAAEGVKLMRLEVYQLLCPMVKTISADHRFLLRSPGIERRYSFDCCVLPQPDWHRTWVAEVSTLADAEAWIAALSAGSRPEHHTHQVRCIQSLEYKYGLPTPR